LGILLYESLRDLPDRRQCTCLQYVGVEQGVKEYHISQRRCHSSSLAIEGQREDSEQRTQLHALTDLNIGSWASTERAVSKGNWDKAQSVDYADSMSVEAYPVAKLQAAECQYMGTEKFYQGHYVWVYRHRVNHISFRLRNGNCLVSRVSTKECNVIGHWSNRSNLTSSVTRH
jgi:hypothetical protein